MSASSHSLTGQIDAIRRQTGILQRNSRLMRESEAAYEISVLQSAIVSLQWLQRNQGAVRAAKAAELQAAAEQAGSAR